MRAVMPFAIVVASFALTNAAVAQKSVTPPITAQDRLNFEAGLANSPGATLFHTIQRLFPADYERLIREEMTATAAAKGDKAALLRTADIPLAQFFQRKTPDVINAPAPALVAVNQSKLDLMKTLQQSNVQACAHYFEDGTLGTTQVPVVVQHQVMNVQIKTLEAAKVGEALPKNAARRSMNEAAAGAWLEKLNKFDPSHTSQKLLDDDSAYAKATPEQKCRLGINTLQAVAALPPEQGAHMTAQFLNATKGS